MGKQCPVFHDLQLDRQERDERKLIKVNPPKIEYRIDLLLLSGSGG